jgi:hypothetical protein
VWRNIQRGLLTAGGKEVKNKEEILQLLEAVWELSQVAVVYCSGAKGEWTMSVEETAWLTRWQEGQQRS